MISPQGHHQKYLDDVARRAGRESGAVRPAPPPITIWWVVRAAAILAATVVGCAGFAEVTRSASVNCYEVSRRVCLSLVVDDLTGKPVRPVRPVRRDD